MTEGQTERGLEEFVLDIRRDAPHLKQMPRRGFKNSNTETDDKEQKTCYELYFEYIFYF